jgi:hypothetical protein
VYPFKLKKPNTSLISSILSNILFFTFFVYTVTIKKLEFQTLSKTDKFSIALTDTTKDPKNLLKHLTPERFIDYRSEEISIKLTNDGYSVIFNLKEKVCWDVQDYLQDNQDTHSFFMLCKVFTDNKRTKVAFYGVAKVAKGKTEVEYSLKTFTKVETDVTKVLDHECLTMLLIKNV